MHRMWIIKMLQKLYVLFYDFCTFSLFKKIKFKLNNDKHFWNLITIYRLIVYSCLLLNSYINIPLMWKMYYSFLFKLFIICLIFLLFGLFKTYLNDIPITYNRHRINYCFLLYIYIIYYLFIIYIISIIFL